MQLKTTAPTWGDVEAAKVAHEEAVAALAKTRVGTYWRMAAADVAESANRRYIRLASAYWNAMAGEDTDDTIERRVYRAADLLAERLYAGVSATDLAWVLEEAGVLR